MKFHCKKYHFHLFFCLFIGIFTMLIACETESIDKNAENSELVAKKQTIELQQIVLIDAFLNSWESQILPIGAKNMLIDSNEFSIKRSVHFGKSKLCGDYITRSGSFTLEIIKTIRGIDSISCIILPEDSFGISTSNGIVYFNGVVEMKRLNQLEAEIKSNFNFTENGKQSVRYMSHLVSSRILKFPTTLNINDGIELNGKSEIMNQLGDVLYSSDVIQVSKITDAPNFPISGHLNVISGSKKSIKISFDAFNNWSFDKIAKATSGNTEWIFDIQ